jgi:predicted nucleic acid-binding protein
MSASCSVPAGNAAALICDTGALIDYLVESAPDHQRFRDAIDQARARYVPGLVLAEVDYFLRDQRSAMQVFIQDVAQAPDDHSSDGRGVLTASGGTSAPQP